MTNKATVHITIVKCVELDIDALVQEHGPKARAKAFLEEQALVEAAYETGVVIEIGPIVRYSEPERKFRRINVK